VLDLLADDLTPEIAPWYTGAGRLRPEVVARRPRSASTRRSTAGATCSTPPNSSATPPAHDGRLLQRPQEKRAAQIRHAQAIDQINLLQRGHEADVERLLHLPLPRHRGLPARLQLPAPAADGLRPGRGRARGQQTYLQRPRFLALSEFGPRSLVYHEGRAFRVVRALLSPRPADRPRRRGPTPHQVGAHLRHLRRRALRGPGIGLPRLHIPRRRRDRQPRLPHRERRHAARRAHHRERRGAAAAGLRPADHLRVGGPRARPRRAPPPRSTPEGEVARLAYGPGRASPGSTRACAAASRQEASSASGSTRCPATGPRARTRTTSPPIRPASPRQWIVPSVQDHKNALLFTPTDTALTQVGIATLQHALLRGIEPCSSSKRARSSPSLCPPATAQWLPALRGDRGRGRRARSGSSPSPTASPRSRARRSRSCTSRSPTTARCPDATAFTDQPGTPASPAATAASCPTTTSPTTSLSTAGTQARGRRSPARRGTDHAVVGRHRIDSDHSDRNDHARHLARRGGHATGDLHPGRGEPLVGRRRRCRSSGAALRRGRPAPGARETRPRLGGPGLRGRSLRRRRHLGRRRFRRLAPLLGRPL
jgi:hypothetical protein